MKTPVDQSPKGPDPQGLDAQHASGGDAQRQAQNSPQVTDKAHLIGLSQGEGEARVERLALNLRSYAYAMGAPRTEQDEEVALDAARLILPALEKVS